MKTPARPHHRTPSELARPATVLRGLVAVHATVWVGMATVITTPTVAEALRFDPSTILSRPWSIISYVLVHDGFVHFAVLIGLLALTGPGVENHLGSRRFLLYYLYCTVGGAAAGLVLSGLVTVQPTGGALAPVFGVVLARTWIGTDHDTAEETGSVGFPIRALVGSLAVGVLFLGITVPVPGLTLPHAGGLLAGYIFWRLRSVGRQRPPSTPLPIRHVVLTRAHAERDATPDSPAPPTPPSETPEPTSDTTAETLDRLLDKISAQGIKSLTADERASLTEYAKLRRRDEVDS